MGYNSAVRDIKCKVIVDFTSPFMDEIVLLLRKQIE